MTYSTAENVNQLMQMTDMEWGIYAFSRDPIGRKIIDGEKEEFIRKANECGVEQAKTLKKKFGNISIKNFAVKLGLMIKHEESEGSSGYIMFAKYNYPKTITIYMKNVQTMIQYMKDENFEEALGNVDVESVLLAHEMYHYCEENWKNVYSKQTKVVLWKIGKFQYKSTMIALGEIAAMAFAKELLKLNYNPYVFDALMLYPHNRDKAETLTQEIFAFKQREEEANE